MEIVDLELIIIYETEKAYCVIDSDTNDKEEVWIPKSQMEIESIKQGGIKGVRLIKFAIPTWLAMEKGLI